MSTTTAPFEQLDALCAHVMETIRANAELARAFGVAGKDLCKVVLQRKAFDAKEDSAVVYTTQMPALAIFPTKSERYYVRGNPGMRTELGIQYLFKQPVHKDDFESMERVNRALHLLWWVICDAMQAPNPVTAAGLTDTVSADEASYVGPMEDGTCGLDGSGAMTYSRPPYVVPAAPDLRTIHGDYNVNAIYGAVDPAVAPDIAPLMESTTDDLDI